MDTRKGHSPGRARNGTECFSKRHGGTLFLDEIGEMSFETQAMFLRILETQEFTRVGGNQDITVDVRIITATNKDLAAAVENGKFRRDLYYRLNGFHIHIPSLRERREDIPPLVAAFISEISTEHGKRVTGITPEALQYLKGAAWPGNIRELKNAVDRAMIITQTR